MADLQLSCGIDTKLEDEINIRVNNPIYLNVIANILPDIIFVFGKHHRGHLLKDSFIIVFKSSFCDSLLRRLPEILEILLPITEEEVIDKKVQEDIIKFKEIMMKRINDIWKQTKLTWRNSVVIVDTIGKIQKYFPLDTYNSYYLDEFCSSLKKSSVKLQKTLLENICKLLACNYQSSKRLSVLSELIALSTSRSFYNRRLFLPLCYFSVKYLSLETLNRLELFQRYLQL